MDHVRLDEQNVVERYVLGQLDPDEATDFEQHYLDCPRCLEKLELTAVLHDGLRDVAAEEAARAGVAAFLWAWWQRQGRALQAGLVTAMLALIVVPWAVLVPRLLDTGGVVEPTLAPRIGSLVIALSPERSAADEPPSTVITLGHEPEWVVLNLRLPPHHDPLSAADWRLRLSRAENIVWSGPIQPDGSGQITLSVHSDWLEPSIYRLELVQVGPDGTTRPVTTFAFDVRRGERRPTPESHGAPPSTPETAAAKKTYIVSSFDGSPLKTATVLRVGSTIQFGDNGLLLNAGRDWWDTYPTCKSFDYVGIAKVVGNSRPDIWYTIKVVGSGLKGTFWDGDPCQNGDDLRTRFPSNVATWEADEENVDP